MVAKVEAVEPPLLAEERDDGAAGPVHALAEHLLDVELVLADGDAVHELSGAKPVANHSFHCAKHTHYSTGGVKILSCQKWTFRETKTSGEGD